MLDRMITSGRVAQLSSVKGLMTMVKLRPFETVTVSYSACSEAHLIEQMTSDVVGRLKGFRPFMVTKCGIDAWQVVYGTDA